MGTYSKATVLAALRLKRVRVTADADRLHAAKMEKWRKDRGEIMARRRKAIDLIEAAHADLPLLRDEETMEHTFTRYFGASNGPYYSGSVGLFSDLVRIGAFDPEPVRKEPEVLAGLNSVIDILDTHIGDTISLSDLRGLGALKHLRVSA